jgi:hypothetical protein
LSNEEQLREKRGKEQRENEPKSEEQRGNIDDQQRVANNKSKRDGSKKRGARDVGRWKKSKVQCNRARWRAMSTVDNGNQTCAHSHEQSGV